MFLIFLILCLCVGTCLCEHRFLQEELGLRAIVSFLMGMLQTKLGSSAGAAGALNR